MFRYKDKVGKGYFHNVCMLAYAHGWMYLKFWKIAIIDWDVLNKMVQSVYHDCTSFYLTILQFQSLPMANSGAMQLIAYCLLTIDYIKAVWDRSAPFYYFLGHKKTVQWHVRRHCSSWLWPPICIATFNLDPLYRWTSMSHTMRLQTSRKL